MPYPKKAHPESILAKRRNALHRIRNLRQNLTNIAARARAGTPKQDDRKWQNAWHRKLSFLLQEAGPYLQQRIAAAKLGGLAKSEAKSNAARANGKLGGRPRKNPPAPQPIP